jgi:hypothetical protein
VQKSANVQSEYDFTPAIPHSSPNSWAQRGKGKGYFRVSRISRGVSTYRVYNATNDPFLHVIHCSREIEEASGENLTALVSSTAISDLLVDTLCRADMHSTVPHVQHRQAFLGPPPRPNSPPAAKRQRRPGQLESNVENLEEAQEN